MKNKLLITFTFILFIMILMPVNANAASIKSVTFDNNTYIPLLIGANEEITRNTYQNEVSGLTSSDDEECSGDNSLLGNPNDESSVAWLLQLLLNYLKILGPMIVIVMSSIDFAKGIIQSDDETMQKAQKKLVTRLILAAVLFFVPTLVTVLLEIFGITADPLCGLK